MDNKMNLMESVERSIPEKVRYSCVFAIYHKDTCDVLNLYNQTPAIPPGHAVIQLDLSDMADQLSTLSPEAIKILVKQILLAKGVRR